MYLYSGVKGLVGDAADNELISGAAVEIEGRDHPTTTTALGEFWRVLLPGNYTIKVTYGTSLDKTSPTSTTLGGGVLPDDVTIHLKQNYISTCTCTSM